LTGGFGADEGVGGFRGADRRQERRAIRIATVYDLMQQAKQWGGYSDVQLAAAWDMSPKKYAEFDNGRSGPEPVYKLVG
jgi:hypothetical protein